MGNKLLKAILLFFLIFSFSFANSEIEKIDSLIEKIKIKRVGLDNKSIKKLKDPFYYSKFYKIQRIKKLKKHKKNRIRYKLYAIFNNKAKINNKWYKLGSKVNSYKLIKICNNCVKLKKGRKILTLYIGKKSKKIKFFRANGGF